MVDVFWETIAELFAFVDDTLWFEPLFIV